jgi:hypothetical protein
MRIFLAAALMCLGSSGAWAQGAVQQSGPVTPDHIATWVQDHVVKDGGPVPGGGIAAVQQSGPVTPGHVPVWVQDHVIADNSVQPLNSLQITGTGTPFCVNDGPITGPYHALCLGASANGGGLVSYNAYGGAAAAPLQCNINGVVTNCGIGALPFKSATVDCGAKGDGITDDTAALQACINGLPATGGTIVFGALHYVISGAGLVIGNGTASGPSSQWGVTLIGMGNPRSSPQSVMGYTAQGYPLLDYTGSGTAITVNGPLQGWGVQNLRISCRLTSGTSGIKVVSAQYGNSKDLAIDNCQSGILSTTVSTVPTGLSQVNSGYNAWYNISITLRAGPGYGISLDSAHPAINGDTDFNTFDNVYIALDPGTGGSNRRVGLYFANADNNYLHNINIGGGSGLNDIPVIYDYSFSNGGVWPAANAIAGLEPGANNPNWVQTVGNPAINGQTWNYLNNLSLTNGAAYPIDVPALLVDHSMHNFVPTLIGDTTPGSPTYSWQHGWFIENGFLVQVYYSMVITNTTGMAGNLTMGNLPVHVGGGDNESPSCFVVYSGMTIPAAYKTMTLTPQANTVLASFEYVGGTANVAPPPVPITDIPSTGIHVEGECAYHR